MFTLKRTTTEPGSPIEIMVDQPQDGDGGFTGGGHFRFYPAGSDEGPDTAQVSDLAAKAIMDDPEVAKHFSCTPPWPVGPQVGGQRKPRRSESPEPEK